MDKKFLGILSAAVLVEALITYTNTFFVEGPFHWQMIASLLIGVVVAIAYKIDLPSIFDMKTEIPFVGNIITGILISRGSNYIFDLINNLSVK